MTVSEYDTCKIVADYVTKCMSKYDEPLNSITK